MNLTSIQTKYSEYESMPYGATTTQIARYISANNELYNTVSEALAEMRGSNDWVTLAELQHISEELKLDKMVGMDLLEAVRTEDQQYVSLGELTQERVSLDQLVSQGHVVPGNRLSTSMGRVGSVADWNQNEGLLDALDRGCATALSSLDTRAATISHTHERDRVTHTSAMHAQGTEYNEEGGIGDSNVKNEQQEGVNQSGSASQNGQESMGDAAAGQQGGDTVASREGYMPEFDDEEVSFGQTSDDQQVGYVQMIGPNGDIALADEPSGEAEYLVDSADVEPLEGPFEEVQPNVFEQVTSRQASDDLQVGDKVKILDKWANTPESTIAEVSDLLGNDIVEVEHPDGDMAQYLISELKRVGSKQADLDDTEVEEVAYEVAGATMAVTLPDDQIVPTEDISEAVDTILDDAGIEEGMETEDGHGHKEASFDPGDVVVFKGTAGLQDESLMGVEGTVVSDQDEYVQVQFPNGIEDCRPEELYKRGSKIAEHFTCPKCGGAGGWSTENDWSVCSRCKGLGYVTKAPSKIAGRFVRNEAGQLAYEPEPGERSAAEQIDAHNVAMGRPSKLASKIAEFQPGDRVEYVEFIDAQAVDDASGRKIDKGEKGTAAAETDVDGMTEVEWDEGGKAMLTSWEIDKISKLADDVDGLGSNISEPMDAGESSGLAGNNAGGDFPPDAPGDNTQDSYSGEDSDPLSGGDAGPPDDQHVTQEGPTQMGSFQSNFEKQLDKARQRDASKVAA